MIWFALIAVLVLAVIFLIFWALSQRSIMKEKDEAITELTMTTIDLHKKVHGLEEQIHDLRKPKLQ